MSVLASSPLKQCEWFLANSVTKYNVLVLVVFDSSWSDRPLVFDRSDVVLSV